MTLVSFLVRIYERDYIRPRFRSVEHGNMDNRSQRTGSSWGSVLEDSVGCTWMDLGAFDLEDETSVVRSDGRDVPQECLTEQNRY